MFSSQRQEYFFGLVTNVEKALNTNTEKYRDIICRFLEISVDDDYTKEAFDKFLKPLKKSVSTDNSIIDKGIWFAAIDSLLTIRNEFERNKTSHERIILERLIKEEVTKIKEKSLRDISEPSLSATTSSVASQLAEGRKKEPGIGI